MSALGVSVTVTLCFNEVWAEVAVEGLSGYAPDAVADVATQTVKAFTDSLSELRGHGIMRTFDDDEDEDAEE